MRLRGNCRYGLPPPTSRIEGLHSSFPVGRRSRPSAAILRGCNKRLLNAALYPNRKFDGAISEHQSCHRVVIRGLSIT